MLSFGNTRLSLDGLDARGGIRATWPSVLSALLAIFVLSKIFYNLYLHPLRKYPGPFWARATPWWRKIQNLKTKESPAVSEAHQKYGPIVRVTPNELSFSDPKAADVIYGNKKTIIKGDFYKSGHFLPNEINIFGMINTQQHAQRRKLMTTAFSQSSMLEFLPDLAKAVSNYITAVKRESSKTGTADFFKLSHWFSFEVVITLAYDSDLEMLKTGREHPVMESVLASGLTFLVNDIYHFDSLTGSRLPLVGRAYAGLHHFEEFGRDVIRKWRQTGKSTPFMQRISERPDEFIGRQLRDEEILEESMGMMFAGSGTTANTLAYLFWEMSKRPDMQKKLRQELEECAKPSEEDLALDYEAVKNLPYLNAIIKETMRLWPTIPGSRPRKTLEPLVVMGEAVPANTTLSMRNYVTHRNASVFPDPLAFKPERWFSASKEMRDAETGFGSGNRACIGRNLAMMEMQLLVANILWNFELSNSQNITVDDMNMVDTFNGAPQCQSTVLGVKSLAI